MDESWAKFLSEHVTNAQISIDGPRDVHDYIRGRGVFDKATRAIGLLQEMNVPVGIRMTLCRKNNDFIEEYVDLARDLGLKDAYLRRIIPSGNAKKTGLGTLGAEELKYYLGRAIRYGRQQGVHVASADYFCQIEFNDDARKKADAISAQNGKVIGGCAVGINSFYLMQDGVIAYCPYLPVYCGDLKEYSLRHIWENSDMLRVARSLRFNLKGKCGGCHYKFSCGGCRAYAYAVTGDILASDPGCWIK